jgi:hypothetical protein
MSSRIDAMSDEPRIPEAPDNQGEGNRDAAKRYNEETREHLRSGDVEKEAREASGQDPQEAAASERAGREPAKEEDPEVSRDYASPVGRG